MSTRNVILVSAITCLFTMAVMFAFLFQTGIAPARGQAPQGTPAARPSADNPEARVETSTQSTAAELEAPEAETAAAEASAALKTEYLHVSGTAFTPMWPTGTVTYSGNGCVYAGGENAFLTYVLVLPSNATITELRLYYIDSNSSEAGSIELNRYDDGHPNMPLLKVSSSGASGSPAYASVEGNAAVDPMNYSYAIVASSFSYGTSTQLCGVRVRYTVPQLFGSVLPYIQR